MSNFVICRPEEGKQQEQEKSDEKEWLRQSFLNVDEELKTQKGQNEVGDLRREKPPKKPAILNILGDADKDKKDPSE